MTYRVNRPKLLLAGLIGLVLLAWTQLASTDSAKALEIRSFGVTPTLSQAGGHPDVTINYAGESREDPNLGDPCQCNDPKDIIFKFPPGFIGNPHAVPRCELADFARNACPWDAQVGTIETSVAAGPGFVLTFSGQPVFNMVPRPNEAGLLAAKLVEGFFDIPLFTTLSARTGSDYGLNAASTDIQRTVSLQKFSYELWGVPADSSHDALRGGFGPARESNSPLTPFLQNPGSCASSSLVTEVTVSGYDSSFNTDTDPWPTPTGCDQLSFNPSLAAKPTTTGADSPSGIDVDLTVPQQLSPTVPSPSAIKAAKLTLPVGFSINPNAADGKVACTDAQARFGTEDAAQCPEYSKVGTDVIDSSALPEPIPGGMYIGQPLPGNRYRLFLTADGYATHIKLAGTISTDKRTGQVVVDFPDLPQSPLTEFNMHLFGAERGILATPEQCGTYPVVSNFVPWDEALPSQSSTQFFTIDQGPDGQPCPAPVRPFSPSFSASSIGNTGGSYSPFVVDVNRSDGNQNLSSLIVANPPGFTASLAGVSYCPESSLALAANPIYSGIAELSRSICPPSSGIGTSIAAAGAGSRPVYLGGKVYLAGPYKGAPLSLAIITPAVSGPYDLGNVVVRAAIQVDPADAHVTTVSDPLPQLIDGIPLRIRTIRVSLDRPNFTRNPTNCARSQVSASIIGDQGGKADLQSHYQVSNCYNLAFEPKLKLKLTGGVRRRGHPAIHAVLRMDPDEANPKRISVTLPKGELLDNAHIGSVCTRVNFARDACPPQSRLGRSVVNSPLLDQPLQGAIYLRSSTRKLPVLALDLKGQVDIQAEGQVDSVNGRLRTIFAGIPDLPVSRIKLDLQGGKKGLLQNSETLCGKHRKSAMTRMKGQNGALVTGAVKLRVNCKAKSRTKSRKRGHK